MAALVLKRLFDLVPVLLVVAAVVFAIVHITPGDPARVMLGDLATEAEVARLRSTLGLDRPLPVQFVSWLGQLARGDLGDSIFLGRPALTAILERAEPTILLTLTSLFIAAVLGIGFGVVAAVKHGSWIDQLSSLTALIGVSIPNFWFGLLLILSFAVHYGWFPSSGYVSPREGFLRCLYYLALPALTLGISQAALISRITRSAMLDVLKHDFVRTAVAKGLSPRVVIVGHALKNAFVPILTVIGIVLAALLSGAIVVETVFAIPGVGRLVITSIARRDYPVIQGVVIVITVVYVLVNLVVDVMYMVIDPRIRY